jgi:hypothetical protein
MEEAFVGSNGEGESTFPEWCAPVTVPSGADSPSAAAAAAQVFRRSSQGGLCSNERARPSCSIRGKKAFYIVLMGRVYCPTKVLRSNPFQHCLIQPINVC